MGGGSDGGEGEGGGGPGGAGGDEGEGVGGEDGEDGEGSPQQAPSHFAESEFFFLSSHNCVHFFCFSPLHNFFTLKLEARVRVTG